MAEVMSKVRGPCLIIIKTIVFDQEMTQTNTSNQVEARKPGLYIVLASKRKTPTLLLANNKGAGTQAHRRKLISAFVFDIS